MFDGKNPAASVPSILRVLNLYRLSHWMPVQNRPFPILSILLILSKNSVFPSCSSCLRVFVSSC
jgi:hypothetical protein